MEQKVYGYQIVIRLYQSVTRELIQMQIKEKYIASFAHPIIKYLLFLHIIYTDLRWVKCNGRKLICPNLKIYLLTLSQKQIL